MTYTDSDGVRHTASIGVALWWYGQCGFDLRRDFFRCLCLSRPTAVGVKQIDSIQFTTAPAGCLPSTCCGP